MRADDIHALEFRPGTIRPSQEDVEDGNVLELYNY